MRRFLLITLILGAMVMIAAALASFAPAAPPGKDIAVVDIPDKTRLLKAELQGKYIFVHDDEKMAAGEPYFYVYRYSQDKSGQPEVRPENLVVAFHCQPVQREKRSLLYLTCVMTGDGAFELREIQFAGSLEGHRVP